jgi:MscS family membrane protein
MNEFVQRVWWDNRVQDYLLVAGVILFVIVLNRVISRYFAGLIFRMVHAVWNTVERKSFINLVVQPLGTFLVILVSIIALYKLRFPQALDVEVYRHTLRQILYSTGIAILIIAFIWFLVRIIDFIAVIMERKANLTPEQTDNQLVTFFKDFFKVIVVIIGILLVLKFAFGLAIGSLLTGLSIVGAAIALALRESLENLIASFIIFFDKPFTVGDSVKVQQVNGTIEKIGLRSTRIRTDQKTLVTVPNKQMVDSILDNQSLRTQRKGELKLDMETETSAEKLSILVDRINLLLQRDEIEEKSVLLSDISNKGYQVQVEYFTAPLTMSEFNSIKQTINFEVLKLMEDLEMRIAVSISRYL